MRNPHLLAALIALTALAPAFCQTATINSVRIYTDPAVPTEFYVDGQAFWKPVEFLWPVGSKHTVTSYSQVGLGLPVKYVFKGWVTNLSPNAEPATLQPLTASSELKWIKLVFQVFPGITMWLDSCPSGTEQCSSSGRIEIVDVGVFDRASEIYLEAGRKVIARAFPSPGYVFTGWAPISGFGNPATAFEVSFVLDKPRILAPQFRIAATIQANVAIQTEPSELLVLLDRTPYKAPVALEWQWDSIHSVSVPDVQLLNGTSYVFHSWSDGGSSTHDIVVPAGARTVGLTAKFVRAAGVSLRTSPPGLGINVDGSRHWSSYDFAWMPGSTHKVSAPATQTDGSGRKFEFVSWSNGKPPSFDYTAGESGSLESLTATYRAIGQITIRSEPAGVSLTIDGRSCATPCSVERSAGAAVQVSTPDTVEVAPDARLVFAGWKDSPTPGRTFTASGDPATYTVLYRKQFRLSLNSDPTGGALLHAEPAAPDGYYDVDTPVVVSASVHTGFRVLRWAGSLSGNTIPAALVLDSPKAAILELERVPAITSSVRNAASGMASREVAPGSLISIYGVHLAREVLVGPAAPLSQSLGGVTVRVGGAFLPLLFASPEQINAQLVSGIESGSHRLIVRVEGRPETAIDFEVARNAPGLFTTSSNMGLFVHDDGRSVTLEDPARPGETITAFGTGLGSYRISPPDGFLVAESPEYATTDPIEVVLDGVRLPVVYAGRTAQGVGVDAIRFTLPTGWNGSRFAQLRLTVNGVDSNTVALPLPRAAEDLPAAKE